MVVREKPNISVIVPTKNRTDILKKTLKALIAAGKGMSIEILVVNDSKDELRMDYQGVKLLKNSGHGAAAARNFGAKQAQADLLLFLDDDIIVSRQNLERTIYLHRLRDNVCYNFFWRYPDELTEKLHLTSIGRFILSSGRYSNAFRLPGRNLKTDILVETGLTSQYLSIKRNDFFSTGGYDDIPYAGVEDVLLAKKMNKCGIEILLSLKDIVYQFEPDRVSLPSLMERYRTGAITVRTANGLGHKELDIGLPLFKRKVYARLVPYKNAITRFALSFPNLKILDPLYFRLVGVLLGLSSYQGYYKANS